MEILKIDRQLKMLVKSERKITFEILLLIQTLDLTKSYTQLSYSSLYSYLTEEILYSEGAAQRRIASARLLKACPEFENDMKSGALNLSQLSLAQTAFNQVESATKKPVSRERKIEVLSKLRRTKLYGTKRILVDEFPEFHIKTSPTPGKNKTVQVTLQFTEEEYAEVQELMAKISHSVPDQRLESALLYWAREKKKSPPKKSPPLRLRKPVSRPVNRYVMKNANEQCEYISPITGKRCNSKHFVEVDHIVAVAQGGSNDLENLRAYCRSHNRQAAKEAGLTRR